MATLSEVIDQYLAYRVSVGKAPATIRSESRTLRLLLADTGNIQTQSLRPQHLDIFWERRTTWGANMKNTATCQLRPFFRWCQGRGHISRSMELMPERVRLKVEPRHRIIIPQEEFDPFLSSLKNPRQRAACAIGLYLFTRISETQNLRWQDIYESRGHPSVDVMRLKTKSLDTLPLCEELYEELNRWRFAYTAEVGTTPQPGWFVLPKLTRAYSIAEPGKKGFAKFRPGKMIPTERARLAPTIQAALESAGYYQLHEGGHTLRRSGATALYNRLSGMGHDRAIRICQAMLGHAQITTTELYLRLDLDRKVRDDLLSGQPMFPERKVAKVIPIAPTASGDGADGQEDR